MHYYSSHILCRFPAMAKLKIFFHCCPSYNAASERPVAEHRFVLYFEINLMGSRSAQKCKHSLFVGLHARLIKRIDPEEISAYGAGFFKEVDQLPVMKRSHPCLLYTSQF